MIRIDSVWVKQEALNSILNLYCITAKLHKLWRLPLLWLFWTLMFLYIWHNICTQCFQTSALVHVLWQQSSSGIFSRAIANLLSSSKFFYWYHTHLVVLCWYHHVSCWTLFSCFFVASCLYPSFEAGNICFYTLINFEWRVQDSQVIQIDDDDSNMMWGSSPAYRFHLHMNIKFGIKSDASNSVFKLFNISMEPLFHLCFSS